VEEVERPAVAPDRPSVRRGAVRRHQDQFIGGDRFHRVDEGTVVGQSETAKERSNDPPERVGFAVERERPD